MTAVPASSDAGTRFPRTRPRWAPGERRNAAVLFGAVAGLHLLGFFILVVIVVPQHYRVGAGGVFGLGLGITAYTLGLRHAFDADHICAIDNATRKLVNEGRRPLSAGFFFSLGHSTIVFALAALLAIGIRGLGGAVKSDASTLHQVAGVVGPVASGAFLLLIGVLNLLTLVRIVGIFRGMRRGRFDEAELERELNRRGFMNRVCGRAMRALTKPWQMYPLGVLFGLGLDTATEVALLVGAGAAAAAGLPWYAILCLPLLFAAGMSLLDTIDGAYMSFAYGWSLERPVRTVLYNIAVTGLSVAVALAVGTVELVSVLAERLDLRGGVWDVVSALDLNVAGYVVVGVFVATWAIALSIWRFGRIDKRLYGRSL